MKIATADGRTKVVNVDLLKRCRGTVELPEPVERQPLAGHEEWNLAEVITPEGKEDDSH